MVESLECALATLDIGRGERQDVHLGPRQTLGPSRPDLGFLLKSSRSARYGGRNMGLLPAVSPVPGHCTTEAPAGAPHLTPHHWCPIRADRHGPGRTTPKICPGYKYILVILDYATRYPGAVPVRKPTSREGARDAVQPHWDPKDFLDMCQLLHYQTPTSLHLPPLDIWPSGAKPFTRHF